MPYQARAPGSTGPGGPTQGRTWHAKPQISPQQPPGGEGSTPASIPHGSHHAPGNPLSPQGAAEGAQAQLSKQQASQGPPSALSADAQQQQQQGSAQHAQQAPGTSGHIRPPISLAFGAPRAKPPPSGPSVFDRFMDSPQRPAFGVDSEQLPGGPPPLPPADQPERRPDLPRACPSLLTGARPRSAARSRWIPGPGLSSAAGCLKRPLQWQACRAPLQTPRLCGCRGWGRCQRRCRIC